MNLSADKGYDTAKQLLKEKYGKPWLVAEEHLRAMTEGPDIKTGDCDALSKLALRMNIMHFESSQHCLQIRNRGVGDALEDRSQAAL